MTVGGGGRWGWASRCVAECLIGESIEIESTCGLTPALEIVGDLGETLR
jgi:hypothetical protein